MARHGDGAVNPGGDAGGPGPTSPGTTGSPAMPEGTLYVDPSGMRSAASLFDDVDMLARRNYDAFKYGTDAIGECWGNDSTGQSFMATYDPAYRDAVQGIWSIVDNFSTIGDNVREWAHSYEKLWAGSNDTASQVRATTEEALGGVQPAGAPATGAGTPNPKRSGGR